MATASLSLDEIERLLDTHKSPKAVFDAIDHKSLLLATHPDRNIGEPRAAHLYKRVNELFKQLNAPATTIKSPKRTYTLNTLIAAGDVADIHDANEYVVKISRVVPGKCMLENEYQTLVKLLTAAGDLTYRRYLPTVVESFSAKDKIVKQVNVFMSEPGFYTLEEVKQKHVKINPRHIVWIYRRLLSILGFVHSNGIVHGAITPAHVQVHAANHGIRLLGWGQSVTNETCIKNISTKYKDMYPPEVFAKKPATAETDIYMAAKCMKWFEADLPVKMSAFFNSNLIDGQKMRPDNAWALSDEFTDLIKNVFGHSKFVTLDMT